MAMTKDVLKAKARGFTISIEKMNEKQRTSSPTGNFGEDYNRLRSLVLELRPDLQAALPPAVTINRGDFGTYTRESYGEIDTYCEQIFQILSSAE
jgi:hypothetical protein